jgi:hypothetical protein
MLTEKEVLVVGGAYVRLEDLRMAHWDWDSDCLGVVQYSGVSHIREAMVPRERAEI